VVLIEWLNGFMVEWFLQYGYLFLNSRQIENNIFEVKILSLINNDVIFRN
jgi:hypothetical protein